MAAKTTKTAAAPENVISVETRFKGTISSTVTPGGPQSLADPDPDHDGIAYNGKPIFTTEQAAHQLDRNGAIWPTNNGVITYTFAEKAPGGQYNNPHNYDFLGSYIEGFEPFTPEQRDAARKAIQLWDDLVAVRFVEKNGAGADIVYMNTSTGPAQAAAYTPFYNGTHGRFAKIQGDVYVNQQQGDNFDLKPGGYGETTLVHETGHALGLEHPGDYNFAVGGVITYAHDASYFQDSYQYSIMSYFNAGNTGATGFVNWATGGYYQTPQTPMIHDIAAVQAMYGADLTTRTGDTTYGFNSNAQRDVFDFTTNKNPFLTIYDAGGHDTLDLSGFSRSSVLDLREGHFSTGWGQEVNAAQLNALYGLNLPQAFWDALFDGRTANPGFLTDNIGIAFGTVIEDGKTGVGNDTLIGNDVGNRLDGGAGNDKYTGNGGADVFVIAQKGFTDTITDFQAGVDKLDLSAFHISASDLSFSGNVLLADTDHNGIADLAVVSQTGAIAVADILFG
ncbi:MAG: M10 family metallopeptidase [Alphaproteobacteria bacterium]|nr:M10 family metallopeptidase [Alphaproteobacteria bacterium]MBV9371724.1 M10 family metallopeptidase [Alphaproteobacteria bacterium]MBV9902500.1 M10 family metallopeptidase [Alphaproteobacteria bacterium]